jgi:hypothetical protein
MQHVNVMIDILVLYLGVFGIIYKDTISDVLGIVKEISIIPLYDVNLAGYSKYGDMYVSECKCE